MTFEEMVEIRHEEGFNEGKSVGLEEGKAQGMEQGAYNKSLETAKKLLAMTLPLEKIAEATGLPLKTVLGLDPGAGTAKSATVLTSERP